MKSSIDFKDTRGLPSLEKAQGLGPCSAGIHGFKSHPPHSKPWFKAQLCFNLFF